VRIFSICCVRDEHDVVIETLTSAAAWSERIFVLDNGSTDGTWERLQELASRTQKVVLLPREFGPFSEELRGNVFEDHKHLAQYGDWWCRLDADEIYIDDPLEFLARTPRTVGFVRSATFNYYFTDEDLKEYHRDPELWLARPIQDRLRYYQNNWSEGRFVRHKPNLRWKGNIWPTNRGLTCQRRIRLKHFQYRSPEQIDRRLRNRQKRLDIFPHEAGKTLAIPAINSPNWASAWMKSARFEEASWADRVHNAGECDFDSRNGFFRLRESLMPPLPSPLSDLARAALQETRVGSAMLSPIVAWRHRRRGAGGTRDPKGPK